jgi:hypothetical protein
MDWVKGVVHGQQLDLGNLDGLDVVLLCNKPFQVAMQYTKMKAYGDHFRVEDPNSRLLQTSDTGIASMFEQQIVVVRDQMSVQYVGLLKDILKLDYGCVRSPIIIFRCEWMK